MIKIFTREQLIEAHKNYDETRLYLNDDDSIYYGCLVTLNPDTLDTPRPDVFNDKYVGIVMGYNHETDELQILWEKDCGYTVHWDIDLLKVFV